MVDDTVRSHVDADGELCESLTRAVEPLTSTEPDAPLDDLDVVGETIGDADVIGMGEASHGTREFFRFKHRLFRYLVEEHGFRMLGLEANFAAVLDINDYVVRGEGSADASLSNEWIHRPYQTESIVELVEWIRSFNEGRPRADRIRFHGIDIQFPPVAAARLETYFETVDPAVLAEVQTELDHLVEHGHPDFSDEDATSDHLAARETVVARLREALTEYETAYVHTTSRREFERAERLVWMIDRGYDQFRAISERSTGVGSAIRIRDGAMAAQVEWLLGHEPVDRIALWAHNAHVTRGRFAGGSFGHAEDVPSLGNHLSRSSTVDYHTLGLLLAGGTVGATTSPEMEYRTYDVESPPEGSVPEVFGRIGEPLLFLNVDGVPADSAVAEWARTEPNRHLIVGGRGDSPVHYVDGDFRRQFDGLVFIEETTAARPVATGA